MRSLVVLQFLLDVGDLSGCLGALACETLIDSVDGDIDEPTSSVTAQQTLEKKNDEIENREE